MCVFVPRSARAGTRFFGRRTATRQPLQVIQYIELVKADELGEDASLSSGGVLYPFVPPEDFRADDGLGVCVFFVSYGCGRGRIDLGAPLTHPRVVFPQSPPNTLRCTSQRDAQPRM